MFLRHHVLAVVPLLSVFVSAQSTLLSTSVIGSNSPSATSSPVPKVWPVTVGKADHKFFPDIINAAVGDIVSFQFFPPNHSVVRAEYEYPCIPYEKLHPGKNGFFSGLIAIDQILEDPPTWNLTVNDTSPIFFYCSAPGSCINYGMVGVINPNKNVSLDHQRQLAKQATFMLQPGEEFPPEASSTLPAAIISATASTAPSATGVVGANSATSSGKHNGLSTGAIAGIAVGSAAGALVLAALLFFIWRSRRLAKKVKKAAGNNERSQAGHTDTALSPHAGTVIDAGDTVYVPVKKRDLRSSGLTSPFGEVPPYDDVAVHTGELGTPYSRTTTPGLSPPTHHSWSPNVRPDDMAHGRESYNGRSNSGLHEMPASEMVELNTDYDRK